MGPEVDAKYKSRRPLMMLRSAGTKAPPAHGTSLASPCVTSSATTASYGLARAAESACTTETPERLTVIRDKRQRRGAPRDNNAWGGGQGRLVGVARDRPQAGQRVVQGRRHLLQPTAHVIVCRIGNAGVALEAFARGHCA